MKVEVPLSVLIGSASSLTASYPCARLAFAFLLSLTVLAGCRQEPTEEPRAGVAPAADRIDTLAYVGRAACAGCHQAEATAWNGSDHDLAMAPASAESVLGDFDDAVFTQCGIRTRFFREGDRFLIHTEGPDGAMETFEVKYTFGYRPLQQYLIAFPDGRIQSFTIAWDTEEKRWFSLYPEECIPASDWLHWTKAGMNWNYMCADCHSTNLQKNFELATNTYQTSFSEIDVSCEACHGPGERHVAWARSEEESSEEEERYEGDLGLTVQLQGAEHARDQVETCAPCHSRRRIVYPDFIAGREYLDHYEPSLLTEELYFPDGQIKDEVYVYGSFLQSKMYHNGVRCSDCHDPHSTRLRLEGNALCTQCHEAEQFDTFEHFRHPVGTPGSQCVDCHMPERTYMVVDPRRDHSFKVPRPDLSVALGTPNACTGCHTDQTASWAAEKVAAWYGPERKGEPPFARAFAAAREREPDAESSLREIVRSSEKPALVRATALFLLDPYNTRAVLEATREALGDPEPMVRTVAIRNLEHRLSSEELVRALTPLVSDPVRLVRTEAAQVLSRVAADRFARTPETDQAQAFWDAFAEYRTGQLALSDQAAAHVNLALSYEGFGNLSEAEAAYRSALRMDSTFVAAHANLAMLFNRQRMQAAQAGRQEEALHLFRETEASLRRALRLQPGLADIHYTLGLLLAEDPERLSEAAEHLSTSARLAPDNARMQYNAGLAQQQLGHADQAERFLLAAHQLAPNSPDYLNALSVFYSQQEEWPLALRYTRQLMEYFPNDPALAQRLSYIEAQMSLMQR